MGFIAITIIANMRGLNDSAAVGIVEKIIGILFLVPSTLLSTVSALAALNIGAGEHGRVRQILLYAVAMAVGYGLVIGVTMQFAADGAVSLFAREAEVIRLGGEYLRGYAWDCLFAGIHFSFSGFFCAYGLSGISFLHNIVSLVCARLPLAYLASTLDKTSLTPMGFAAPHWIAAVGGHLSGGVSVDGETPRKMEEQRNGINRIGSGDILLKWQENERKIHIPAFYMK